MTPQESIFVECMVRSGDPLYAAEKAGYAHPAPAASKLSRRPEIVAAITAAVRARVMTEGATVAAKTLIEIAQDGAAPKAPRVAAARALAEMVHLGAPEGSPDKPLSEMSRAELVEARQRAVAYLAELDAPVIEGTALPAPEPVEADPEGGFFD